MSKFKSLLLSYLFIISCSNYPPQVKEALMMAGKNRPELERVIKHYRKYPVDSLKLKAAYFLISNTPYHYTAENEKFKQFDEVFDSISAIPRENFKYSRKDINTKIISMPVKRVWDYFIEKYGLPSMDEITYIPDCKTIKSDFLIENIDCAFEAWQFPWAHHLSFEQFCEYVLPYRFKDEPLESWRPYFMDRYKWVIDSIKDPTDPVEIYSLINREINSWLVYDRIFNNYPRALTHSQIIKGGLSFCAIEAEMACFSLRSMGLAITDNMIPQWGNRSTGHEFSGLLTKDGKFHGFHRESMDLGKLHFPNRAPKIMCNMFSLQNNPLLSSGVRAPSNLVIPNFLDVTANYVPAKDITIDIKRNIPPGTKFVYLCVFNNSDWVPVHYAHINNNKATFKSMGLNIMYLPMFYDGNYSAASDPFAFTKEGEIIFYCARENDFQQVILTRKYPYRKKTRNFSTHLIGGKIQGANCPDFSDAVDLYFIQSAPEPFLKCHPVSNISIRYARYVFPEYNEELAAGNIAELAFNGRDNMGNEEWLNGEPIGIPEIKKHQFEIAFDGKLDNYLSLYVADTILRDYPENIITIPEKKIVWIGLDFRKNYTITQVGVCPRNDTNNIYSHCTYELFYWNDKWISLGIKQSGNNELLYDKVPVNALLLLRNHTEGKEERIFVYENGEQVWW